MEEMKAGIEEIFCDSCSRKIQDFEIFMSCKTPIPMSKNQKLPESPSKNSQTDLKKHHECLSCALKVCLKLLDLTKNSTLISQIDQHNANVFTRGLHKLLSFAVSSSHALESVENGLRKFGWIASIFGIIFTFLTNVMFQPTTKIG